MSEAPKSKPSKSKSETSSTSDTAKTSDSTSSASAESTTSTGDGGGGKSGRAAAGGAGAVHYGFFSNVKTEEYRSGWDAIWGDNDKPKKKSKSGAKPKAKTKEPVLIDLDFADLPRDVQEGLARAARTQLKKSRINYDNRAEAKAVSWHIACEVKR